MFMFPQLQTISLEYSKGDTNMNDTLSIAREEQDATGAITKLAKKGVVSARDVAVLRRESFGERSLSRIEIEALFGLDRLVRPECEAWAALLAEVVTDHVVWDCRPTGIVTEGDAEWLFRRVDGSRTLAGLGVLIEILEGAHRVPYWFAGAVRRRAVAGWTDGPETELETLAHIAYAA